MQHRHHKHRLSIDISPEAHRLICKETIKPKIESETLQSMTTEIGHILKELWNNKKDSDYDRL